MKKINVGFLWSLLLFIVGALLGSITGLMMAASAPLTDGGKQTASGINGQGALTESGGREDVERMYLSDVDKRVTKIRPMATPIDQISRYAKALDSASMEIVYYSVGTKPIKTTLSTAITAQTSGSTIPLVTNDSSMFDLDDTIRVVGIKGFVDGTEVSSKEDLVLCVSGVDTNGNPTVFAVNGKKNNTGSPIYLPAIPAGTTIIRMGKACGELDAQTAAFANIPTPETQYCQNFMMQIEESTFNAIASKEVDWTFSDLEEDSVYDMRMGQECSFLFSAKGKFRHPIKKSQDIYFTQGLWWQAGKDLIVGEWDTTKKEAIISDDELVNITKDLFTGVGAGNKRKILFAGSNMLAAFSKIKSEKFRLKDSVEVWNLKFKSFDTDFGEILVIHHELFDQNDMSDCGFCMDPAFLTKKTHVAWDRSVLDLKSAGIRNVKAVLLQEVSCLYLRYKKAHARLILAKA
ncbi:MAG: hypothetical protein RR280_07460 [Bacteroidaceae bacterium]